MDPDQILENEIFKEIKDFPGYYISNFGRLYSCKKEKFLSPCDDKHGYLMLHLWKNNKQYVRKIHRLVAESFIENPENLSDVNHKDENKTNNYVENLEWCSRQYNLNYGTRSKRQADSISKAVNMINKETQIILSTFKSSYDAYRQTGINAGHITQVCKHNRKTAGGFLWEYAQEVVNEFGD